MTSTLLSSSCTERRADVERPRGGLQVEATEERPRSARRTCGSAAPPTPRRRAALWSSVASVARATWPRIGRDSRRRGRRRPARPRGPAASRGQDGRDGWSLSLVRRTEGQRRRLPSAGVSSPREEIEIDGREVRITPPGKVFFPERGETKLDLVHDYLRVAEPLMRTTRGRRSSWSALRGALGGRPSSRSASGTGRRSGWRRRSSRRRTARRRERSWPRTWRTSRGPSTSAARLSRWPYLAADPEHTDELRLDLDPQPGTDFTQVREAAAELKGLLRDRHHRIPEDHGLPWPSPVVRLEPRWDSYHVGAAVAAARELERRRPDLLTAQWWKDDRGERIFVDFNQMRRTRPCSALVRARSPWRQVRHPLRWDEIDAIHPDELTITSLPARIEADGDPWPVMNDDRQSLEPLLETHGATARTA